MYEIIEGFLEAVRLIVTFDTDVMAIAARSIVISLTATIIASLLAVVSETTTKAHFGSAREFGGRTSTLEWPEFRVIVRCPRSGRSFLHLVQCEFSPTS